MKLTYKDIETILGIENNILHECNDNSQLVIEAYPKGEDYYGEILRRFNNQRIKPQRMISAEAKESLLHDKYEGLTDFERTLADICIGWIGEELGWKQYIKDNADVLLKIAVKKFNSVQDVPFEQKSTECNEDNNSIISDLLDYFNEDKCLKHEVNDIVKWLKTIKPQQKGWSDNEIKMFDNLITYLDGRKGLLEEIKRTYIDWLKSIKSRVKPKQEWSEEDQNALEDVREAVVHYWGGETQDILLYWLKSIKQKIKGE